MIVLYFLYEWLIFMPLFILVTILAAVTTIIGCHLGNNDIWGYYPGVVWARVVAFIALCPCEVKGKENLDPKQSYVFVANHQGAADILLLFGYLGQPFRWMLRQGIKKIPFMGRACDISGQIWVDESGARGILHTVRLAISTLKNGKSVIIFPEGTRSKNGHLNRFKKGAFTIAAMLKLPVVPVTLEGPFDVLPKGSVLIHPHRMKLTIHKPIPAVTKEEGNEAGVDRLLHTSQRVIAEYLGEPIQK